MYTGRQEPTIDKDIPSYDVGVVTWHGRRIGFRTVTLILDGHP